MRLLPTYMAGLTYNRDIKYMFFHMKTHNIYNCLLDTPCMCWTLDNGTAVI